MMEPKILKVGQVIERDKLFDLLFELRYQRKESVSQPGEFSHRGLIVDIFPVTYRAPVRLEFEMDKLSSIRDFSPLDGRTLTSFEEVFLIPLTEVFERKIKRFRERFEAYEALTELRDLMPGDYVVHLKYGIGRFLGTKYIEFRGQKKRHMAIEYADREILYLGMDESLERYIGGEGHAPRLTKLNTKEWERIKEKTRRAVQHVARDLLVLQAKRVVGQGIAFPKDQSWQQQFEAEFPFEETPDQIKATEEVKRDMESPHAMDRLLCGDVGYGKTEVAMRAAFKAVTGGYQVAILVPTTVLAEQHYLVLKQRVRSFPVTVEVLSRFRTPQTQKAITASLKEGTTDIVVGTHRLLSRDTQFKNLGLVIIDEEQRFGVRHKEKLKNLRELVDVLTLTATPIPRTLYMSLMGARNMSVINTPPKNRMPIETAVMEYDAQKIKAALEKEMARGGQAYFVHNRVQSIEKVYQHLHEVMPKVRLGIAHGQMHADQLEDIMRDFLDKKIDCLISTNIIESGIDIPNVNTIFINRADQFGLADLYQLRGRVGRFQEKRQAYAYFIVPKNWVLTIEAEKRLAAIERFTELGSGFKIALEDLEIRGAGNLLGHEQSGFIQAVGFDLYCRMLRQSIDETKTNETAGS
ncbi:MAG: transcription-repair coupling factor [Candidatus Omnitrophica bacterium]|nr:transcription-repair coupling factor [Candidatus Omnitrophota bacterium]MDD5671555.1 transcription-repair coupling factor [Candidatus Omnitrophota bacterium]